jgi:hypothetical protein
MTATNLKAAFTDAEADKLDAIQDLFQKFNTKPLETTPIQ